MAYRRASDEFIERNKAAREYARPTCNYCFHIVRSIKSRPQQDEEQKEWEPIVSQ